MTMITMVGLDLVKSVFQVHCADETGKPVLRKRLRRGQILEFFTGLDPCLVGLEACSSAHYWAREITKLDHEVKLVPPQYVKPFVKSQKNDASDAEAIAEAVQRPTMRFAAIKSAEQQSVLALHCARELLVRQKTMLINSIRGHCGEFGLVVGEGERAYRNHRGPGRCPTARIGAPRPEFAGRTAEDDANLNPGAGKRA